MEIPDFAYVQDEAKFRLEIKKDIQKMGLRLDTRLRNTMSTEELLKLREELRGTLKR
jgi:hypothetical protein